MFFPLKTILGTGVLEAWQISNSKRVFNAELKHELRIWSPPKRGVTPSYSGGLEVSAILPLLAPGCVGQRLQSSVACPLG